MCCEIDTYKKSVDKSEAIMADSIRTQMTKSLLQTSLIELMQEKPFHKITIKEICDRADLNRTTFYLHYTDQTELLNDVITQLENELSQYIYMSDENGMGYKIQKYLEYVKGNAKVYRTLMRSDDEGGARTRIITDIIRDNKEDLPMFGDVKKSRYIYKFIIEGIVSVVLYWIDNDFDLSTETVADLILKIVSFSQEKSESMV